MAHTVTHNQKNEPLFGDEPLILLAQHSTFTAMLFEMLTEKKSRVKELDLFELLLKLSIDHGPDTPSAKETIAFAKSGKNIAQSVARGMATIGERHGGAQEGLMRILYAMHIEKISAERVVGDHSKEGERIPGFGHRLYEEDPRTALIIEHMERLGFSKTYVTISRELEKALALHHPAKTLPLNIDGAIAVALCTLEWKPEWSQPLFIVARSAGLCAQYLNARAHPDVKN